LARQHAFVHGAEHAQGQEPAQGIAVEAFDQPRQRPARVQVGKGCLEQLGVQRRAEEPAGPRLETERREDLVGKNVPPRGAPRLGFYVIVSPPPEW
jgi:hypothetical protein